ncbi:unnamed protein product [Gordionus sp. m RMFG-2023]
MLLSRTAICHETSLNESTSQDITYLSTPKMSTSYLPCLAQDSEYRPIVSWIRLRDNQILTIGKFKFVKDPRINILSDTGQLWTLQIRYTQSVDVGLYECQINNDDVPTSSIQSYSKQRRLFNLTIKNDYRSLKPANDSFTKLYVAPQIKFKRVSYPKNQMGMDEVGRNTVLITKKSDHLLIISSLITILPLKALAYMIIMIVL